MDGEIRDGVIWLNSNPFLDSSLEWVLNYMRMKQPGNPICCLVIRLGQNGKDLSHISALFRLVFFFLPILETCTKKNAKPWIKRLSSGACHECSCNGEIIDCQHVWCAPCPGVTVNIPGKCCPQCTTSK